MPIRPDLLTTKEAATELGLKPATIRDYIRRKVLKAISIDERTNGVPRDEVERYKREHLGRHGRPAGRSNRSNRVD